MARTIAVGIGIMEYPFDTTDGFWRWVDLCEQGGIDSIWQTDRMISRSPILECMTALAAIAGRTRRIKFGVNVVSQNNQVTADLNGHVGVFGADLTTTGTVKFTGGDFFGVLQVAAGILLAALIYHFR